MRPHQAKLSPELASSLLNKWRTQPLTFCDEMLGIQQIWKLQDELLKAIPVAIEQRKAIFAGSGHSLGKDYIASAVALWFLHTYPHSIVVLTAPTDRQVKKIMWGETLRHWRNRRLDLGGKEYADPYIELDKTDWYLIGFTTKETGASADAGGGKFQGFHSPNICVIVSEAQAVEDSIEDQIDAITTSQNTLRVYIGNPTRTTGFFAKGLNDKVNNIVFNFSCLDNPNYKHRRTVIPGLAEYDWVEDKRRRWGENDPRWFGRVLGQVPKSSINAVMTQADIDLMVLRHGVLTESRNRGVSVDPAGEGDDDNVVMSGINGKPIETWTQTVVPPSTLALRALAMCRAINGHFIIVDCDGLGIGCYQELVKLPLNMTRGIQIVKFHGSAKLVAELSRTSTGDTIVRDPVNYMNLRVKAAFVAQDRARRGVASVDPADKELHEDLLEDQYFEVEGKMQLDDKQDVKERLHRSPGRGDAWKMLQWGFEQNYERPVDAEDLHDEPADRAGRGIPVGLGEFATPGLGY